MAEGKIPVSQVEYDKLTDLWDRACISEGKDPKLDGALYVFAQDNPYIQEYDRLKSIIMERNQ